MQLSVQQDNKGIKGTQRKKQNVDNVKNKTKKRSMHITIGYQEALTTGNPQSASARKKIGFDVDMGMSVYVKGNSLYKGDYVSRYALLGTMTAEKYRSTYHNKNYKPTPFQQRQKDVY